MNTGFCLRVSCCILIICCAAGCSRFGYQEAVANHLVQVDPEPAGENCATGGLVIRKGPDSDQDGILSEEEVAEVSYVCHPDLDDGPIALVEGSVAIENNHDVAWLETVQVITGNLVVQTQGLSIVDLPALEYVGGDVLVSSNPDLTSLQLAALTQVEGDVSISHNLALESFELGALTHIGGSLNISDHLTGLSRFDLNALVEIGSNTEPGTYRGGMFLAGSLSIINNPDLDDFGLATLQAVTGDLAVQFNASLPNCRADDLAGQVEGLSGTVYIDGNDDQATCP